MVGSCWIHPVFAVVSQASQYTLGLEGENINIQNIRNCVWLRWLKAESLVYNSFVTTVLGPKC